MLQSATQSQSQSMNELLAQVFKGEFDDFRAYLKERAVVELDLKFQICPNVDLSYLSQALQGTDVTKVCLGRNNIGAANAIGFAKHLKATKVNTVDLNRNNIGSLGAIGFVQHLKGTSVTSVCLFDNKIDADGAIGLTQHLPSTHITTVDLRYNLIGDKGTLALENSLAIQKYLAAYAVMQLAKNAKNKDDIVLNQQYTQCPESELDDAFDIVKKLPNELAAIVAQYLIGEKISNAPLTSANQYELTPSVESLFLPLANYLNEKNKQQTQTLTKEPCSERQKLSNCIMS